MRCQPFAILFALASVNAFAETTPTKVVDRTNSVLAKQGAATVEAIDVDAHLASMPMGDRAGYIDSPKRIEQLLSHLLMRRNMAIEARELGLDKDPIIQRWRVPTYPFPVPAASADHVSAWEPWQSPTKTLLDGDSSFANASPVDLYASGQLTELAKSEVGSAKSRQSGNPSWKAGNVLCASL